MTPKTVSEIIIKENKKIRFARVLLRFNIPIRKYPDFGTWCYLIDTPNGVVAFDSGPKYDTLSPFFRPMFYKTDNAETIVSILKRYFPGKTIREILLSHYHFDHSEAAPQLQKIIKKDFGNLPPIRLHKEDQNPKKLMKLFPEDLNIIFRRAKEQEYTIGMPVKDNERIIGSNFKIIHLPGHTTGTIGLQNDKDKIIVCGWWVKKYESRAVKIAMSLIDEDKKLLIDTIRKLDMPGYRFYYFHPVIKA
ncbi:MAG: MBL fold metallo-hydrolase [Candidatus Woesearchaeota archaeon]|nr:MBL fold metallo-hydrolase [Candidatus Woesearchaeota archaeon]